MVADMLSEATHHTNADLPDVLSYWNRVKSSESNITHNISVDISGRNGSITLDSIAGIYTFLNGTT